MDTSSQLATPAESQAAAAASPSSIIGRHWATQLLHAVDYLKQHANPIRLEELAIRSGVEALLSNPQLLQSFQNHERVLVDDRLGLYSYKPDYVLRSKADLVSLLRVHATRGGFAVKILRESWPQVNNAIEELEREGKLFVMRTGGSGEREGQMKAVYLNEMPEQDPIDKEFRDLWSTLKTPIEDELANELRSAGLSAASAASKPAPVVVKKKAKGRKSSNRRVKIVNTHLRGQVDLTRPSTSNS
ncbi:hypothetical protein OIV83_004742 [Microbotryomycetes sp. JL201]|nr:hypothetical protein OIV83_004742 [Microbotryomycetes sp. JL201]